MDKDKKGGIATSDDLLKYDSNVSMEYLWSFKRDVLDPLKVTMVNTLDDFNKRLVELESKFECRSSWWDDTGANTENELKLLTRLLRVLRKWEEGR